MPKPPPTSPTRTRTCFCSSPGSAAAMPLRTAVGIWLLMRTTSRPLAASNEATTLRGSSETGATRWLTTSISTRTAARANAAAVAAASPWLISAAMLSAASA